MKQFLDFLASAPFLTFVTRFLNCVHIVALVALGYFGAPDQINILSFVGAVTYALNEYLKTLIPPTTEAAQKALSLIKLP